MKDEELKQELEKYIIKHYGKRCSVLAYFCPTCEMWMAFDRIFNSEQEFDYQLKIIK